MIDDTLCHQHRAKAEVPAEETRSHLQTIQEQVVLDVDAEMASTGLGLEAEHWQWKEAAPMHRYTQALDLRAQLTEEAIGQFQDGSDPDEQHLCAVDEAQAAHQAVDSRHHVHNVGLTGDTHHINPPSGGHQRVQQPAMLAGPEPVRLYDNPTRMIRHLHERSSPDRRSRHPGHY
jgi:hypothetical protein